MHNEPSFVEGAAVGAVRRAGSCSQKEPACPRRAKPAITLRDCIAAKVQFLETIFSREQLRALQIVIMVHARSYAFSWILLVLLSPPSTCLYGFIPTVRSCQYSHLTSFSRNLSADRCYLCWHRVYRDGSTTPLDNELSFV